MISSKIFIVLALTFRSLIHFQYMVRESGDKIHWFACVYLGVPAPLVEKTTISPSDFFLYSVWLIID